METVRQIVLKKADEAVNGSRPEDYGSPENSFETIANLWTAWRNGQAESGDQLVHYSASDVAAMLALLKLARLAQNPNHQDSWVDLAGYAACGGEVSGAFLDLGAQKTEKTVEEILEEYTRGWKHINDRYV
jgi:hypothetical protein